MQEPAPNPPPTKQPEVTPSPIIPKEITDTISAISNVVKDVPMITQKINEFGAIIPVLVDKVESLVNPQDKLPAKAEDYQPQTSEGLMLQAIMKNQQVILENVQKSSLISNIVMAVFLFASLIFSVVTGA